MKEVKVVQEIKRKKIDNIIYASYFCGFLTRDEGKSITHPQTLKELMRLKTILDLKL